MLNGRVFRLFLSSTFSDFIAERAALQKTVFPQLEAFCRERGAMFQAVDLRWGITEDAQRDHDTMRICLEEVRRCQQLSPQPNFAVLLGDRYGWEPVPARITQEHWKRLQVAADREDWTRIKDHYEPDKNAVPPVYGLPKGPYDQPDAFALETQLLDALRRAAKDFVGDDRLPYFASATHQEIALGALASHDETDHPLNPEQHVHIYVRRLEGLPNDATAQDFIDWDTSAAQPTPGARERLSDLEAKLRQQMGEHVHVLHTSWDRHGSNGAEDEAYLKQFCDAFLKHQTELITAELGSLEHFDDHQKRERAHQDFGTERARVFAGRAALLAKIARYTATWPVQKRKPTRPLILLGSGGSGKSALLARAAQENQSRDEGSGTIVLQRYIGGVPGTGSLMTMLTELAGDIASAYDKPQAPGPENARELAETFEETLGYASAERPLVLYLDALDQLDGADGAWILEWLPAELPVHVRIVASARTGTGVERSARRRFAPSILEVPKMKPAEGKAMLRAWLADRQAAWFNAGTAPSKGRRLTASQERSLLTAFNATGSALWLKLAYEEAATWHSWDDPDELPITVEGLIGDLVNKRLLGREKHPEVFTRRALAYITAGRFGLSELELARALGTDQEVRAEFRDNEKTQRSWDDTKALPPILWSRLFFDLKPYLGLAEVDGVLLMRWFHREFSDVLRAGHLNSDQARQTIHGALAKTFFELERDLRPQDMSDAALFRATDVSGTPVSAALRRVTEQPWQLAQAGHHEDQQALITDFGFCMAKCAANRAADLLADFRATGQARGHSSSIGSWVDLLSAKGHLLRRGERAWPSHKILLQIASEHADDSAVTRAAEAWLGEAHCDWVWLKNRKRPEHQASGPLLAVMEGHRRGVRGVQVLPDGRILSWSWDDTLRLWDGANGEPLAVLDGHTGGVEGAQVLPDGRILSWSKDGTLRLWDGASGAPLAVLEGHSRDVSGVQVLPDGRILSWSKDGTLRLWDGASGAPLAVLEGHTDDVWGAQVLPDGRILSWSLDHTLRSWDGASGAPLAVLEGHTDDVWGAQVLPDGRILSWSLDHTLRSWDGASGEPLAVLKGHTGGVMDAQVLPNGRVLSKSWDGTLRLWDGASGELLAVLDGHTGGVRGAQVLPDGRVLYWSGNGTLHLWDGASGDPLAVLDGHTGGVEGAQVLPDGRVLSWSLDGTLRLWDGASGEPLAVLAGHMDAVLDAHALLDGRVLSWSDDGMLRLWHGTSGEPLAMLAGHTDLVVGAEFFSDGRVLSWSNDGTLRLWDGTSREPLAVLVGHRHVVEGIEVFSDGRVLSWSLDHTLRLWDGASGVPLAVMEGHTGGVIGAQVLPNGRVLSWSEDGMLRLWDGANGAPLAALDEQMGFFSTPEVLANGRVLSSSGDGTLRLWDGASGERLGVLEGHTDAVWGAEVLPNGLMLSWSKDGTLRLWDGASGEPVAALEGHTDGVRGARVLPNGRILSWSYDGTLRLWGGASGEPLAVLEGHNDDVLGAEVLPDGRILSWSLDHTLRSWDGASGEPLAVLKGHTGGVMDAQVLPNGRVLSKSWDGTLRLWDGASGEPLAVLEGHTDRFTDRVDGVQVLPDSRILSWSGNGTLRLWDGASGALLAAFGNNWVESVPYPAPWEALHSVRRLTRRGDYWSEKRGRYVYVINRKAGWSTRWHGDNPEVKKMTENTIIAASGRNMFFLQFMHGAKPIHDQRSAIAGIS